MRRSSILLFLLVPLAGFSQHYYHDIQGTRETNALAGIWVKAGVNSVVATGYNSENQPDTRFSEVQSINTEMRTLTTRRRQEESESWEILYFDAQWRMIRIVDSSATVISRTEIRYDSSGRVAHLKNNISDTAMGLTEIETHDWKYNADGRVEKMYRVVNGIDSTEFRFLADEDGNIVEEVLYKRGAARESVYYYYNENNQLTDIVRYNTRSRRLLPDFMFEYDETGRVVQKITTMPNPKIGYLIWRYQYNTQGLKIQEANFTREKKLIGRIRYEIRNN